MPSRLKFASPFIRLDFAFSFATQLAFSNAVRFFCFFETLKLGHCCRAVLSLFFLASSLDELEERGQAVTILLRLLIIRPGIRPGSNSGVCAQFLYSLIHLSVLHLGAFMVPKPI